MRQEYTVTDEEFERLMEAAKPVPYLVIGGHAPRSPQENANVVWQEIAKKRGVVWDSIQSSPKDIRIFTAEKED